MKPPLYRCVSGGPGRIETQVNGPASTTEAIQVENRVVRGRKGPKAMVEWMVMQRFQWQGGHDHLALVAVFRAGNHYVTWKCSFQHWYIPRYLVCAAEDNSHILKS